MNYNTHKLSSQIHSHIIGRQDSVTGDAIKANDEVVFCSACQSVFLVESWEYMNQKHCNQTETLGFVPLQEKEFKARKKDTLLFEIPTSKNDVVVVKIYSVAFSLIIFLFASIFFFLAENIIIEAAVLGISSVLMIGVFLLIRQVKKDFIKGAASIKIMGENILLHNDISGDELIKKVEYKSQKPFVGAKRLRVLRIYSNEKEHNEYHIESKYPYNINFLRNLMEISKFTPVIFYSEDEKEHQFLEEKKEEYDGNIILTKKMPFH
jgi:hypothetical protein